MQMTWYILWTKETAAFKIEILNNIRVIISFQSKYCTACRILKRVIQRSPLFLVVANQIKTLIKLFLLTPERSNCRFWSGNKIEITSVKRHRRHGKASRWALSIFADGFWCVRVLTEISEIGIILNSDSQSRSDVHLSR